jgi:hypothetical protein
MSRRGKAWVAWRGVSSGSRDERGPFPRCEGGGEEGEFFSIEFLGVGDLSVVGASER